jgi:hypothetical protein
LDAADFTMKGMVGAKAESGKRKPEIKLGYHEGHGGHEVSVFEFQVLSWTGFMFFMPFMVDYSTFAVFRALTMVSMLRTSMGG